MGRLRVATAAWTIPAAAKDRFPEEGSHLERYAERLDAVEINSSFYKDHQAKTYARWRTSVPEDFRFAVKLAKEFTHARRLAVSRDELREKLGPISELGEKWGALLVQIAPSLALEEDVAREFFEGLRAEYPGPVVFEPRHASWSQPAALRLLREFSISRVLADPDPAPLPRAFEEAYRTGDFVYARLHGSPEIYKSDYAPERIAMYRGELQRLAGPREAWCVFDNTTFGHATLNALALRSLAPLARAPMPTGPAGFHDAAPG